jgi:hypothetical protein
LGPATFAASSSLPRGRDGACPYETMWALNILIPINVGTATGRYRTI